MMAAPSQPFRKASKIVAPATLATLVVGVWLLSLPPAKAQQRTAERIDYNWQVRPVLSDNCYRCHGPDAKARQAGLRLDDKASAYGQAITPGKPYESELIRRITSQDPAYRMPPPASSAKPLTPTEIVTLTEWVRQGAEYKPHWAFLPPAKTPSPQNDLNKSATNAIDRFIQARLQKENLKPAAEADRAALINRVSLTLTGLPPSLPEMDAFLADKSPAAYEKVVDRLLASPAYGEHMAAYWANISRYSESDGFLDDHHDRLFWPYRDWVISAFNRNMRFDQFSTWQIAGDLLPNPTKDQKLATAFLRVGKRTTENGAIDEEYRVEYTMDRANVIGGGFLALTTGCARCHDHKYDPIAQKDFYALTGFFNQADEPGFHAPGFSTITGGPTLRWADGSTEAKIAATETAMKAAEKADTEARAAARAEAAKQVVQPQEIVARIRQSIAAATVAYYPFDTTAPIPADQILKSRARRGQRPPAELVSPFRRGLGSNPEANSTTEIQRRAAAAKLPPNSMIRENLVYSPSGLPNGEPAVLEEAALRPGAKGNALFFTDTNRGYLGENVGFYDRTQPFSFDLWIYAAREYENSHVIDHRDDDNSGGTGYKLSLEKNHLSFYMMHSWPFNMLHVISKQQIPAAKWTQVSMTYDGSSRASGIHIYVDGQLAPVDVQHDQLTESSLPRSFVPVFNEFVGVEFGRRFREVTMKDGGIDEIRFFNRALTPVEIAYLHKPTDPSVNETTEVVVANDPRVIQSGKTLYAAREAYNQAVSWVPEVMVMADAPQPRQTYVLNRGLYNVHLDPVAPSALPSVLPFDAKLPRNRLGLAQWLFDPKNPLVARVFVNRMWQMQFGTGIVETADDFGMQGSQPTHPELLDWLAVDFMESGWDVKRLNKMIVMSAAFRQNSQETPALLKQDPHNLLYARGPRMRMSAEQIRDNALAVSGLLVRTIGGPSAYPYQPEGVWVPGVTQYDYPKPDAISPDNHHRRSLYTFVKRNTPPPSMSVFDFSERHVPIPRRLTSNTPLQALVLLDDPQFVEAYRVLATKILKEKSEPAEQIQLLFRTATRRIPKDSETRALRAYYDSELARFTAEPQKASAVVHIGVTPVDRSVGVTKLAALTNVAAAVMNTPDAYSIY